MNYVLGFIFDDCKSQVALIKKNRPEWQAGYFNGIGGKIEKGELAIEAMQRECEEESGLSNLSWKHIGYMQGKDWHVTIYVSFDNDLSLIESKKDERIEIHYVEDILTHKVKTISNLPWIISFILDKSNNPDLNSISVRYQ